MALVDGTIRPGLAWTNLYTTCVSLLTTVVAFAALTFSSLSKANSQPKSTVSGTLPPMITQAKIVQEAASPYQRVIPGSIPLALVMSGQSVMPVGVNALWLTQTARSSASFGFVYVVAQFGILVFRFYLPKTSQREFSTVRNIPLLRERSHEVGSKQRSIGFSSHNRR